VHERARNAFAPIPDLVLCSLFPIPYSPPPKTHLVYTRAMRNEFTAVIERDGEWFIAWSPEIPGANGQGRTLEECRESLGAAIQLILEDRREDGLRGAPADALRDTVTIQ
jgi:predicted RNase H-like HicB family nuclease